MIWYGEVVDWAAFDWKLRVNWRWLHSTGMHSLTRMAFSPFQSYAINMSLIATRIQNIWRTPAYSAIAHEWHNAYANIGHCSAADLCAVCVPTNHTYTNSGGCSAAQVQKSTKNQKKKTEKEKKDSYYTWPLERETFPFCIWSESHMNRMRRAIKKRLPLHAYVCWWRKHMSE